MDPITINDKSVIEFYKENPHINIVSINKVFISILKQLSTNLASSLDNATTSQILSIVSDMNSNITNLKGELYKMNTEIIKKFYETKKEYIDDIKVVLSNSDLNNHEKIVSLFDKSNDSLLTKTTLLLKEVLPKSQDKNYLQIENCIKSFFTTIIEDTNKILKQTDNKESNNHIIENIESKFNLMVTNIQQPLINAIQTSEERTQRNMQQVSENIALQKQAQETLTGELNGFLNKYKTNSSIKGAVSENEMYFLLQKVLPSDDIKHCFSETASCDFKIIRYDDKRPTILVENKDYTASVNKDEVKKFERDLKTQNCHGIFVSQNSPITHKHNYQIDIINNIIHVYVHNANYNPDKIRIAIDIIDNLADRVSLNNDSENQSEMFSLSLKEIEDIREQYCIFANKKLEIVEMIKVITKQLSDKMEDIQLPYIKKFDIGTREITTVGITCPMCNKFVAKSKASLGAHQKSCRQVQLKSGATAASLRAKTSTVLDR